jgi:hypothetical protein
VREHPKAGLLGHRTNTAGPCTNAGSDEATGEMPQLQKRLERVLGHNDAVQSSAHNRGGWSPSRLEQMLCRINLAR